MSIITFYLGNIMCEVSYSYLYKIDTVDLVYKFQCKIKDKIANILTM